MNDLKRFGKKIKRAGFALFASVAVGLLIIPPLVLSQVIMIDQANSCSSESTGSIDVSSDGTKEENKKAIWNYFKASGYSDEATAGIMGNIQAESGFMPDTHEIGGGGGYGLVQWTTKSYKDQLKSYAAQQGKDVGDLKLQLDFLCIQQLPSFNWSKGLHRYFSNTEEFKQSNSIDKTTEAFMMCFERCNTSYNSCSVEYRGKFSKAIYNQFRGQESDADTSSGISGRIIWVGDSRTVGMKNAVSQGNNKWICDIGKEYKWFVNTGIKSVNKILSDSDTIVVNMGVNDIGNYEKYVSKLNELAANDWSKAKNIIVMSVNPVDEAKCNGRYNITNGQIEKFNSYLKSNLRKKITYVDTYTSLLNHIETEDGLHYSSSTYQTIYSKIRDTSTESSMDSSCDAQGSGGILTAEGVMIDFDSKYYTYSSDINNGNPNVCADNKPAWYPYGSYCYPPTSTTGKFNKMICSSYACGRYWDVNYHDSPYPLLTNWDQKLTIDHVAPGNGKYSRNIDNPIAKSIVSITSASGNLMHDAFIEGVDTDGSVVISECNANSQEPKYGFRCKKWNSLREWMDSTLGSGAKLNGMYGK